MNPPSRTFVLAVAAPLLALLNHCDPAPHTDTVNQTQTSTSSGGSSSGGPLAARLDLHCTPQHEGDESECRARGEQYEFGPPPHGHGTQPPPEVVEAERQAYEQGTEACVCMSHQDRRASMMVP